MKIKAKCSEIVKDKLIVLSENKSKVIFQNKSEEPVTKVEVDGCQIDDNGPKCDYLVLKDKNEYFVELKRQDIDHAFEQLIRTMSLLRKNKGLVTCFVICTRSPLNSTKIQNKASYFRKKYDAKFIVKKSGFKYGI